MLQLTQPALQGIRQRVLIQVLPAGMGLRLTVQWILSVEALSRYRLLSTDSPVLTLSDIAKVYETGRGRPIMDDPWFLKTVELHVEQCGSWRDLNDYERLYLKAAIDSKIPFKLNCN